jgi:hypothetical protein
LNHTGANGTRTRNFATHVDLERRRRLELQARPASRAPAYSDVLDMVTQLRMEGGGTLVRLARRASGAGWETPSYRVLPIALESVTRPRRVGALNVASITSQNSYSNAIEGSRYPLRKLRVKSEGKRSADRFRAPPAAALTGFFDFDLARRRWAGAKAGRDGDRRTTPRPT